MNKMIATTVLAAAVVLAPSAASADPGHARPHHGKAHHKTKSALKVKPRPCTVVEMTPSAAASAWLPISLGLICPVIVP